MNRTAVLRGLEALFFLAIGIDFIRNADMGGFFAAGAGILALFRAGLVAAFALRANRAPGAARRWVATITLALLGLVLVVGSAYSLVQGTSEPVVHGLLGFLGAVLLVGAVIEARANRKR